MKAEIDVHGTLAVIAETPLEHYALGKWAEENQSEPGNLKGDNFLIFRLPVMSEKPINEGE